MKINLTYEELLNIVRMVLDNDYKVITYTNENTDDINFTRLTLFNPETHDKVLISFNNNHIEVLNNNNRIIQALQKYYLDYISMKYSEIGRQKDEIYNTAVKLSKKLKFTIINAMYNEGIEGIQDFLKIDSKFTLASALNYVRCGNHTMFRKVDNPYYRPEREIKIGDVFSADLNPVVDAEYGGKRSVVVIGYDNDKSNYVCVPCTTNADGGFDIHFKTDRDLYAVTSKVKIISPMRIFEYRGHIDENMLQKLKEKVNSSYAFFEEKATSGGFKTSISYENAIENTRTLDGLALIYPEKKPSERELVQILNEYFKELEAKDVRKREQLKYGDYYSNSKSKKNTIITLKQGQRNDKGEYVQDKYDFSLFTVKTRNKDGILKYDKDLTNFYQNYMLKNHPNYYIHLLKYICNSENAYFRKQNITDKKTKEEYLDKFSKLIEYHFNELGFSYEGNFKKIILYGSKGFLMAKFKNNNIEQQDTIEDDIDLEKTDMYDDTDLEKTDIYDDYEDENE